MTPAPDRTGDLRRTGAPADVRRESADARRGVASGGSLAAPLSLGGLELDRRLFMAPMAGLSARPLRRSVRRWGAGLVHTEMISACGIHYGNRRTRDYLVCGADEHPIGFQIFGAEPGVMASAAEACLAAGADLVDINMACPVRKVLKTGAGAALLDDPARAAAIVAAVVGALSGEAPVTVKLRSATRRGEVTALDVAPRLVEAGAAAVTLHPRTAAQLYLGSADHRLTSRLAAALPVPVIASGDVTDAAVCRALLAAGAAGVMLARAALGRPWLFAEILDESPPPPGDIRLREVALFVADVTAERGERGVGYLRQFWPRFRRSGTLSREQSDVLMRAAVMCDIRESVEEFRGRAAGGAGALDRVARRLTQAAAESRPGHTDDAC